MHSSQFGITFTDSRGPVNSDGPIHCIRSLNQMVRYSNAGMWDIGWAEAVGFELLARTLCARSKPGQHFRVFGDNKGVVEGWWRGRSRNWETNKVFRRVHNLADTHQCLFITRYVASRENPADGPSRGRYPLVDCLLPAVSIPADLRQYIVDFDC